MGDPAIGIAKIIADLTYINYATNRDASPNITPESWKKVYGPEVDQMEARYKADKAIAQAQGAAIADEIYARADAMIRRDKTEPKWERDAKTGARDE